MRKFLSASAILICLVFLGACSTENTFEAESAIGFTEAETMEVESTIGATEAETMIVMADFPHYNIIEHLATNATEIVRVEVIDERAEKINIWMSPANELEDADFGTFDAYRIFTVNRIRVLEVFQGDVNVGDVLEVKQIGGRMNDSVVINHDSVPLVVGDDLVLFLQSYDIEGMPACLLNPTQSAYRFNENAAIRDDNTELESLNPQNDLTLTLNDLAQISRNNEVLGE
ncbi:MAG: hypothetical protein FWE27_00370 [Defluviitaleaceae bacterium]|nr:hypothetical protein [Defluviitaleaceae bacterium]